MEWDIITHDLRQLQKSLEDLIYYYDGIRSGVCQDDDGTTIMLYAEIDVIVEQMEKGYRGE